MKHFAPERILSPPSAFFKENRLDLTVLVFAQEEGKSNFSPATAAPPPPPKRSGCSPKQDATWGGGWGVGETAEANVCPEA